MGAKLDKQELFWKLYNCATETEVKNALEETRLLTAAENWKPYGDNFSNYGIVENQQASPVPALVEKLTNGIDAILEKRCLEDGIDPESEDAPRSIEEGIERFFPRHKHWDIHDERRIQAEELQVIADGPRKDTSLIIYDNGIGQAPERFPDTFLSLMRGNKNKIHFVQGKYNMGGAGAIVFCGKKRYQLIASKRFDGSSDFGFTLVREHPLTREEEHSQKNTWYEYLVIDDAIPSFPIQELDLGLHNRKFTTGTVIKLYSYDLPAGSRSVISRDLNQSINEYLFSPAMPLFTIDKEERYPKDRNLERHLFGLKRRLEDENKYVDQHFSEEAEDNYFGKVRVTCYVFKPRVDDKSSKETRSTIQSEFFKNKMSVLFSMNGQVHGNYTSEFITRTLKFPLLKDHLLIHVDCSQIKTVVRKELFMASRDRLKEGDESRQLRKWLGELLIKSQLKDINAARKASLSVEGNDAEDMLRNITRNVPLKSDLAKLLNQSFKLDDPRSGKKQKNKSSKKNNNKQNEESFEAKQYPSAFSITEKGKTEDDIPLVKVPLGSNKTIKFSTDVEDQYFDRSQDPGELKLELLGPKDNETTGGSELGQPKSVQDVLNVVKSSPNKGTIRIHVKPLEDVAVGDAVNIRATLTSPDGDLEQIFQVRIADPEKPKKKEDKGPEPDERLGLPTPIMVYKDERPGEKGYKTWDSLDESGIDMSHETVVRPIDEGEGLSTIYINMDSGALLDYRSKLTRAETIEIADKRYFSAVYFHTLFLYAITKNRKYALSQENDEQGQRVEITDYIADLFSTSYAQFLLNFDTQELISALEG